MNLERYEYNIGPRPRQYEFFSEGPRGRIRKVVKFKLYISNGTPYYNLIFGDWVEYSGKIDDRVVSNNGDAQRIFATIAAIVIDFTNSFPDALISGIGSSPSRNRLYQMHFNSLRGVIEPLFEIFGQMENGIWEVFEANTNYIAFLVKRKG